MDGENTRKLYLSQTVCQSVSRLYLCFSDTYTPEFANTSLKTLVYCVEAALHYFPLAFDGTSNIHRMYMSTTISLKNMQIY